MANPPKGRVARDTVTDRPHECNVGCRDGAHCTLTYDCLNTTPEGVLAEARRLYRGYPITPLRAERAAEYPPAHTTHIGRIYGTTADDSPRWVGWLLYWRYNDGR